MFELQQERKQTVVLVHAAVGDDDVQRPVHLGGDTKEMRQKTRGGGVYKGVRASVEKKKKVGQELGKMGDGEGGGCEYRDVDKGGERMVKARRSVREEGKRVGEVIRDSRINGKQEQRTVCAAAVTADTT